MNGSTQQKPNKFGRAYEAAKTSSVGIELVLSIVIGFALGRWADSVVDDVVATGPFLTILMTGCGFVAGVRALMRTTRETQAHFSRIDAANTAAAAESAGAAGADATGGVS